MRRSVRWTRLLVASAVATLALGSAVAAANDPGPPRNPGPPDAAPASPATAGEALVEGTGEELCPWGEELPAGSDTVTGDDNTSNAREFVFGDAPEELAAAERLRASWSAFARGPMGAISPGCTVYIFDSTDIDDIWAWYAETFTERSAPAPEEEPAPAGAPGEDGRLFHYAPNFGRESWSYVFRQGNVIASVSLDVEPGAGPTADDLVPIAEAVAARISAAAEGAPLPGAPSPTPEPSFPTPPEADLLEHVPEAFRESCGRTAFGVNEAARAAVVCSVEAGGGSVTVTYQQFDDLAELEAAYDRTLEFIGVERDSGPCAVDAAGEGSYTIGDEEAGRYGCSDPTFFTIISWTDARLLIHGYAEAFDADRAAVLDWWRADSGPVGTP